MNRGPLKKDCESVFGFPQGGDLIIFSENSNNCARVGCRMQAECVYGPFEWEMGLSCYIRPSVLQRDVRILDEPIDFLTEIGLFFQRSAIPKLRLRLPHASGGLGN